LCICVFVCGGGGGLADSERVRGPCSLEKGPDFWGGGVTFTWWHRHSTAYACLEVRLTATH